MVMDVAMMLFTSPKITSPDKITKTARSLPVMEIGARSPYLRKKIKMKMILCPHYALLKSDLASD